MAKKRKAPAGARGAQQADDAEDFNKRVRLNVDSYEDVAGSDDEFHIGRDKVLLEEQPAVKRARKIQEREQFLEASDEEVLGYSDEDDEEQDDYDEEGADDAQYGKSNNGYDDEEAGEEGEEEDEINEWGTSKQDYYGADQMETEQDALEEEAEAKRLQQKQLASMKAADYGFDEDEWAGKETTTQAEKKSKTVTEALPRLAVSADLTASERLKLFKTRFPEFEPLSKEFLELQSTLADLQKTKAEIDASEVEQESKTYSDAPASGLDNKIRAASAYLGVLAMYFALLTSNAAEESTDGTPAVPTNVRDHPIMDTLLSSRQLWQQVKDLPDVDSEIEESEEEDSEDEDAMVVEEPQPKRAHKSKAERKAEAAAQEAEDRRTQRLAAAEADLADLDDLLARRPSKTAKAKKQAIKAPADEDEDSDFGETELSEKALADKAAKRKSLRFYTSQIAQKSNKRGAAGRSAGGDDDIPYKERFRDRQARLTAEAIKKGQSGAGADLGGDSDEEDRAQARAVRAAADDDIEGEDYYQYIAGKTASKKADKEARAAAHKEALLNGGRIVESETVGEDGKRKITYAIEKNKGLTPHRKKDVRNPRVKKRKKYDERKKKLSSMRATYKGGEGRGGYGGELTGIKSNLVKSRKL